MFEPLKPPRVPLVILNFFASQPDFPAVLGDISEEFHQRIQSYGTRAAHRWFWQEAIRNALALSWRELSRTPVWTSVTALSCIIAGFAPAMIYAAIRLSRYRLDPTYFLHETNQTNIILLLNFIPPLAMGWIGGKLLRGREWALALTFTGISACIAAYGVVYFYFFMAQHPPLWQILIRVSNPTRQGLFWLGALTIRLSRSFHRRVEAAD